MSQFYAILLLSIPRQDQVSIPPSVMLSTSSPRSCLAYSANVLVYLYLLLHGLANMSLTLLQWCSMPVAVDLITPILRPQLMVLTKCLHSCCHFHVLFYPLAFCWPNLASLSPSDN